MISESQEMSDTKLRDAVSYCPLTKKKRFFNKELNFDSISSSSEMATEQFIYFRIAHPHVLKSVHWIMSIDRYIS